MDFDSGIIIQGNQMRTAKLWISNTVFRGSDVYQIMKEFAEKNGIAGKDRFHLGLLTEETLSMARQILHVYDGELWVEDTAAGYDIILEAAVHEQDGGQPAPAASAEGFMAKVKPMSAAMSGGENEFEILCLASEAQEAHQYLIEHGIFM